MLPTVPTPKPMSRLKERYQGIKSSWVEMQLLQMEDVLLKDFR